jgi:NADH dehydrogenase (ubiquinone) 1 alpha subcomplex subunit 13
MYHLSNLREYLKQLRRNRAAEVDLMKDVDGWECGTWFGQSVYKTLPDDA